MLVTDTALTLFELGRAITAEHGMRMAVDERRRDPAAVQRPRFGGGRRGKIALRTKPRDGAVSDCKGGIFDNAVVRLAAAHCCEARIG